MTNFSVLELDQTSRSQWMNAVQALEKNISYPLGDDRFVIDHGKDYFAFFERMGELRYFIGLSDGEVIAAFAAVKRKTFAEYHPGVENLWYMCDVKIAPKYQGRRISFRLFKHLAHLPGAQDEPFYGVAMDTNQQENRIVGLLARFSEVVIQRASTLYFYTLDADTMRDTQPLLEKHRRNISYLSLQGKKDLIMQSNHQSLPLIHVQHGPYAEQGASAPIAEHAHMFCVPVNDPLRDALTEEGLQHMATATVTHHGLEQHTRWDYILTSDI